MERDADDKGQIVSQDVRRTPPWAPKDNGPTEATPAEPSQAPTVTSAPRADDDTVGTGSVIALGCIAGTVLLILIGLLYLGITIAF